jgi:hypothetical protein
MGVSYEILRPSTQKPSLLREKELLHRQKLSVQKRNRIKKGLSLNKLSLEFSCFTAKREPKSIHYAYCGSFLLELNVLSGISYTRCLEWERGETGRVSFSLQTK